MAIGRERVIDTMGRPCAIFSPRTQLVDALVIRPSSKQRSQCAIGVHAIAGDSASPCARGRWGKISKRMLSRSSPEPVFEK